MRRGIFAAAVSGGAWGFEFDSLPSPAFTTTQQTDAGISATVSGGEYILTKTGGPGTAGVNYTPFSLVDGGAVYSRLVTKPPSYGYGGLYIRGANGSGLVFAYSGQWSDPSYIQRVSGNGTFQDNLAATNYSATAGDYIYQRFMRSGANVLCQTSVDGVAWTTNCTAALSQIGGDVVAAGFHTQADGWPTFPTGSPGQIVLQAQFLRATHPI
jgi:hypothetical protein